MIQVIGVTMGHDPNLFVDHKEGDWVKAQQKLGKINVRKINSSFRFIDDLLSLNDDSTFEKHYLSNRIRTEEKKNNSCDSFLDINIYIENGEYHTKLLDKRDNLASTL